MKEFEKLIYINYIIIIIINYITFVNLVIYIFVNSRDMLCRIVPWVTTKTFYPINLGTTSLLNCLAAILYFILGNFVNCFFSIWLCKIKKYAPFQVHMPNSFSIQKKTYKMEARGLGQRVGLNL